AVLSRILRDFARIDGVKPIERGFPAGTLEIAHVDNCENVQAQPPRLEVILDAPAIEVGVQTDPTHFSSALKFLYGLHLDVERRSSRTLHNHAGSPGVRLMIVGSRGDRRIGSGGSTAPCTEEN